MATVTRRKSQTGRDAKTGRLTETGALATQVTSQTAWTTTATPTSSLPAATADPGPQSGQALVTISDYPGFEKMVPFSGYFGWSDRAWAAFAQKNGIVASERQADCIVGP